MVLDIGISELVSNKVAVVQKRGSQDVRGAARYPQSGAGLISDPLLCPDEDEREVAPNPLSGTELGNDLPLRAPESRRGVARIPPSGGVGRGVQGAVVHTFNGVTGEVDGDISLDSLPAVNTLLELDEISIAEFGEDLKAGDLAEVVVIRPEEELNSSSVVDEAVLEDTKKALSARRGSAILNDPSDPFYPVVKEYMDVVFKNPPMGLPPDRGVRHEIDMVPGTKYCVTRQWPLPKEQCDVIDVFFRAKHVAGLVHESKSAHFLSTIPAQMVLQNNMVGCTLYSALDLVYGYYELLMRACDVLLAAMSTPSGMLWEWLVMPQGLSNVPATFNRLVTQFRAEHGKLDVENHEEHLRAVLECMRTNKLYANLDKCVFGAEEIPFLGCFIGKRGLWADPAKAKAIVE
ncbi:hypothetical protein PC119_g16620 [Phytophthora cactorum]|nr:hypothetical protein PC114_g17264 [Phytophthora cactorum]KAG3001722.1 hypothetical protein PC119_g16620 [Phytophthora cactorum]